MCSIKRFINLCCIYGHMKNNYSILSEELQYLKLHEVVQTGELAKMFKCSKRTIYRRLKEYGYLKSYNKNGSFITLSDRPDFDVNGIWQYKGGFFSKWKTIPDTICYIIDNSEAGYTAGELITFLKVELYHQLTVCLKSGKIYCDKIPSRPIYYNIDVLKRDRQLNNRKEIEIQKTFDLIKVSKENIIKILVVALRHQATSIRQLMPLLELEGVFVVEKQVEWVYDKYKIKKKDSRLRS